MIKKNKNRVADYQQETIKREDSSGRKGRETTRKLIEKRQVIPQIVESEGH